MQKALIYCRVSSVQQKTEGHGLESQEHRCTEYAIQKGYKIERVFRDSFSGGGDFLKRPAMVDLLHYAEKNLIAGYIVIFDDLKRFARDTEFHLKLRSTFKALNLKPECLNFNFDESPAGRFAEIVMAAAGELERLQNRSQVIQKQKARLERGYWVNYAPPGYQMTKDPTHGKLLTPIEPQAAIVRKALEGYASGRFQEQIEVLNFLKKKNYYSIKHGKKCVPSLNAVRSMLERVAYAGYIERPEWDVSRRKGHHIALISLETFEKIQDRLNGKVRFKARKDIRNDFPLRGFIDCVACHRPLTASWSKGRNGKFPYYRCNTIVCSERNRSIKKILIETRFEEILKKIKPSSQVLRLTKTIFLDVWNKKISELSETHKQLEAELELNKIEQDNILGRITKTQNDKIVTTYESRLTELTNKQELLQERLVSAAIPKIDFETALDKVFEMLKNPYFKWDRGDINDKRLVLKLVFAEKLVYDREKGFETAILALPLRVFELNDAPKSQLVEVPGIEPGSDMFEAGG